MRACACPDELKNGALFCKTAGHLKTKLPGGYVLLNGVIYGSNWVNNNSGNWCAIDWETGKTLYSTAWSGKEFKTISPSTEKL